MSDFEEKLNAILSNPESMGQIMNPGGFGRTLHLVPALRLQEGPQGVQQLHPLVVSAACLRDREAPEDIRPRRAAGRGPPARGCSPAFWKN